MSSYVVTKVRKEWSHGHHHRHVEGVITESGLYFARSQVVDSIRSGDTWVTVAGGYSATIDVMASCPQGGCQASPYLRNVSDSTEQDNLENLPEG
jgi:hypothetical protein